MITWDEVEVGDELPGFRLPVSHRIVTLTGGLTLDYFPGQFHEGYVRERGHPTIFMNTLMLLGLVDRLVTDWTGPRAFIVKHGLKFASSVYAGEDAVLSGRVSGKRTETLRHRGESRLLDIEAEVRRDPGDRLGARAWATVAIDGSGT